MAERKLTARENAALVEAGKFFGDPVLGKQRIAQFYIDMANRSQRKGTNTGRPARPTVPTSNRPSTPVTPTSNRPVRGAGNYGNKNAVRPGAYKSPTAKKTDLTAEIARELGMYATVGVGVYGALRTDNPLTRAIDAARANKGLPPRIGNRFPSRTPNPAPRVTPKPTAKTPNPAPRATPKPAPKATPKPLPRASTPLPRTTAKPLPRAAAPLPKLGGRTSGSGAGSGSGGRGGRTSSAGAGSGRSGVRMDPSDLLK